MERKPEENWHIVGVIPESVSRRIGMKGKTPIWISEKIVKHIADRHQRELARFRTTALAFVRKVVVYFSVLALTGCSCQQRLERLHRRCPDCFTQTTAHVRDTLPVPEKTLSGSVPWAWLPSGDTILIENRDITLQLLLDGDSLKADVTVQPDTLYIDRDVTGPCPECDSRLQWLHPDVAIAAAIVTLLALLARKRKNE